MEIFEEAQHLLPSAEAYIKQKFYGEGTGHDWFHIERVKTLALKICDQEGANPALVTLIALLHDLGDRKLHNNDDTAAPRLIGQWMRNNGASAVLTGLVIEEISLLSYKGEAVDQRPKTLEGQIVQDADRLDAMGAIGIARTFAYGGAKGRLLYHPEISPKTGMDAQAYKTETGPTVNHFYEKLLLLKDRMNTATGKKMAEGRHAVMEGFLRQFFSEWQGKK